MKTFLTFLIIAISISAHAEGWDAFSGYNESKELITLAPDYSDDQSRIQNISDIHSWVYVGTDKSQYAIEMRDLCHQHKESKQNEPDIWCDGNKDSPLHGATYRWIKTIEGPSNVDYSDKKYINAFPAVTHAPQLA